MARLISIPDCSWHGVGEDGCFEAYRFGGVDEIIVGDGADYVIAGVGDDKVNVGVTAPDFGDDVVIGDNGMSSSIQLLVSRSSTSSKRSLLSMVATI